MKFRKNKFKPCVASDMKLHFPAVSEPLPADVTLERSFASVESDVDLEPVTIGVLAGAVPADERRFKLD